MLGVISTFFFFFNDTATTEIYTLSLHALFRSAANEARFRETAHNYDAEKPAPFRTGVITYRRFYERRFRRNRSEEHTSELQSPCNLVCRLLLEKKKNNSIKQLLSVLRVYELHS